MLEAEFKTDLTDRKEEIGDLVMKMLTAGSENDDEEERNSKQTQKNGHTDATNKLIQEHNKTKGKKNVPNKKSDNSGSEQDCKEESADEEQDYEEESADEDLKDEEEVVPKKKTKLAPNKGKKSSKKVDDEQLAKQLQDEEFDTRPSRRCKTQPQKPKQQKAKKERAKGTSLYSRPCALLPPLSKVLGTDSMPRPEVVKRLWEIAKERNLQDPSNKQFMLCDEEMQELFGKKKVRLFGMMKILKPYIKDLPKL
ncbi:hypothetical protein C0Q70_09807 [Pomacea canaliculata]|uniref:DM2 domain-containing protein n=2 Tax=Pomacea canaliculata TaxID=400727 RepID=A0A2T7PAU7_POMCA|nr:hypothetical protein C0Q70_09807 [Pomacea canaliculata]